MNEGLSESQRAHIEECRRFVAGYARVRQPAAVSFLTELITIVDELCPPPPPKPMTDKELLAKWDAGEIDHEDLITTLRARG